MFLATDCVLDRHIESNAQCNKMFDLGAWITPLFPVTHPNASFKPTIKVGYILKLTS
jgi:hypothetical protein